MHGMELYGAEHTWNNGRDYYGVSNCQTRQEAIDGLWRGLNKTGYTKPRWWQFWRWSERIPPTQ